MTLLARRFAVLLLALLAASPAFAQPAPRSYSQAELDQMLAPIALYPDPLLSQVLMAATYPLEVVEAARWTRSNPGLKGEAAVRAVQNEDWDPSVKSLVAFPQILQRMDEQLDWTRSLGDAFLAQEAQLMDQVQQLRRRAQAAGHLRSDEQIQVEQRGQALVVQPASPQLLYVPYYDPLVVYGPWWWPAYQPVAWAPWPGYARPYSYYPAVSAGLWWGTPVGLSVGFFFGNFDWGHRHVRVVHPTAYYYRPPVVVVNRTVVMDRARWQHDPHHRRQVDYRAPELRQRYESVQAQRQQPDVSRARQQQLLQQQQFQQQQRQQAEVSRARQQQLQQQQFQQQQRQQDEVSRARQQQLRQQAEAVRAHQQQQRPQQRQEQRPMPAAQAPQQPRAERQERREESRDGRREQRQERGQKG